MPPPSKQSSLRSIQPRQIATWSRPSPRRFRPLQPPTERLLMTPDAPVHLLMDRIEAVDREVGLPFGWFFHDDPRPVGRP
jgi:hypothetical protein